MHNVSSEIFPIVQDAQPTSGYTCHPSTCCKLLRHQECLCNPQLQSAFGMFGEDLLPWLSCLLWRFCLPRRTAQHSHSFNWERRPALPGSPAQLPLTMNRVPPTRCVTNGANRVTWRRS